MTKKVTGKDLQRLLKEAMLTEAFPYDPQALKLNKSDGGYNKNSKINPSWAKEHEEETKFFANTDNEPSDFSKKDFDAAMTSGSSDFVSDLLNYYFELYLYNDKNLETFLKAIEKNKPEAKTQFNRIPFTNDLAPWKSTYHGDTTAKEKIMNKILKMADPQNKIKSADWDKIASLGKNKKLKLEDFKELMKDPSHPLHFPMLTFVERAYVLSDKGKIEGKTIFKKLIRIAEEAKIDPDDLALGRDKSIPQFDVHTRYAEKAGASTPETLQRIFDNAFPQPLSSITDLNKRVELIQNLTSHDSKKGSKDSIEKIMSKTIVYDYLRRIVMDYESSAAGFLFENFLALMVSGTKEGGNMRIEDFSFRTGGTLGTMKAGSAKLYGPNAEKFGGSCKLLVSTLDRESYKSGAGAVVHYFLAKKGKDLSNVEISTSKVNIVYVGKYNEATAGENKIDGIPNNSHYWLITSDTSGGHIYQKFVKGKPKFYFAESTNDDTQWELDWPKTTIGSINFSTIRLDKEGYNEELKGYMDSTNEQLGAMFRALNNFQVDSTKYFSIMEDGKKAGDEKISSFDSALKSLENLRLAAFTSFDESGKRYSGISKGTSRNARARKANIQKATKGQLPESKITPIDIKKLIEESFKRQGD